MTSIPATNLSTPRPTWPWLLVGLALALAAVLVDARVAAVMTQESVRASLGVWIHRTEAFHVWILVVGGLIAFPKPRLALLAAIVATVFWAGGYVVGQAVESARDTAGGLAGSPMEAFKFLTPLFAWLMVFSLLVWFPNRVRMLLGFLAPVLASTAITHLLKWAIGRGRPELGEGVWHFVPFHDGDGKLESFPSGHSSAAMTTALVLSIYFPRGRPLFFAFALMVGCERMINDKHYLSDVIAGFTTAALAVWLCVRLLGPAFYRRDLPPEAASAEQAT